MRRILRAARWHLIGALALAIMSAAAVAPASAQSYWPYGGYPYYWGWSGLAYGVGPFYGYFGSYPYGYFDPRYGPIVYGPFSFITASTTPYGYWDPRYGPIVYGLQMTLDPCIGGINFWGLPIQCPATQ